MTGDSKIWHAERVMADFAGSTFTEQAVELDGNSYTGCRFIRCRLIHRGGKVQFDPKCEIYESELQFEDAAKNTLDVLRAFGRLKEGTVIK